MPGNSMNVPAGVTSWFAGVINPLVERPTAAIVESKSSAATDNVRQAKSAKDFAKNFIGQECYREWQLSNSYRGGFGKFRAMNWMRNVDAELHKGGGYYG
jgi:hypothetical protein